jgi:mono/diheme cytochrome c family protein
LDELLGLNRRAAFAEELSRREYGGRRHSWRDYSAWGRELVISGQVKRPPTGPAPSVPLSEHYRCFHCHNFIRENPRLTVQDPEAREKLIRKAEADKSRQDGLPLRMMPGTTFWGAVNRERFYNGHYARYHNLKLSDGSVMNPARLPDAIQICCNYCSSGRYPEPWELDSIHAYFWDLELRLDDLGFSDMVAEHILANLKSGDAQAVGRARDLLRQNYLRAAAATAVDLPAKSDGPIDTYPDGSRFEGDCRAGNQLYQSACAVCHGTNLNPVAGRELVQNDRRFHRFVWHGTERDGLYMPLFTAERLSRQQAADIRAYLSSLSR